MINFAVPGMYEHYDVIIPLCSIMKLYPHYFNDNININAVYGNFQFCHWDGGRIFGFDWYKQATKEDIKRLQHIYNNELNIPMRLIFTTNLEHQDICYSYFDNLVASLCENEMNEIVVASNTLENYLRNKYPKYSFISSTTKCLNQDNAMTEINKDYKMVCLDYNLNKNMTFLNSIPEEDRDKVEFLINAICPPGCPSRKDHYKLNSLFNYSCGKVYAIGDCNIVKASSYPLNYPNNFNFNELVEYEKNGFVNFKLEGRTFQAESLIIELVKYLVKPEYQFYIMEFLLRISKIFNLDVYTFESFKNVVV